MSRSAPAVGPIATAAIRCNTSCFYRKVRSCHVARFGALYRSQTLRCSVGHRCQGMHGKPSQSTMPTQALHCFYQVSAPFKGLKPSAAALGTVAKTARLQPKPQQDARTPFTGSKLPCGTFRHPLQVSNPPLQRSAPLPRLQGCNPSR